MNPPLLYCECKGSAFFLFCKFFYKNSAIFFNFLQKKPWKPPKKGKKRPPQHPTEVVKVERRSISAYEAIALEVVTNNLACLIAPIWRILVCIHRFARYIDFKSRICFHKHCIVSCRWCCTHKIELFKLT